MPIHAGSMNNWDVVRMLRCASQSREEQSNRYWHGRCVAPVVNIRSVEESSPMSQLCTVWDGLIARATCCTARSSLGHASSQRRVYTLDSVTCVAWLDLGWRSGGALLEYERVSKCCWKAAHRTDQMDCERADEHCIGGNSRVQAKITVSLVETTTEEWRMERRIVFGIRSDCCCCKIIGWWRISTSFLRLLSCALVLATSWALALARSYWHPIHALYLSAMAFVSHFAQIQATGINNYQF